MKKSFKKSILLLWLALLGFIMPMQVSAYYIAGWGGDWSFKEMGNDQYTFYAQPAKEYEFKIAQNANWDTQWACGTTVNVSGDVIKKSCSNGGNIIVELTKNADVTISFNGSVITVNAVENTTPIICSLKGSFDSWGDGKEMTLNGGEYQIKNVSLTVGQEVKIYYASKTAGYDEVENKDSYISKDNTYGNIVIEQTGTYSFYYKISSNLIWLVQESTSSEEDYDHAIVCDPQNTKVIFKETFGTLPGLDARTDYSVTDETVEVSPGMIITYSASIPSYTASKTECGAMADAGRYTVLANPRNAGCGTNVAQSTANCNCYNSSERWYRDTEDHTDEANNGYVLFEDPNNKNKITSGADFITYDGSGDEIYGTNASMYGGMLLYNCANGTGSNLDVLYQCTISGLCENTFINFSAFVTCANTGRSGNIDIQAEFKLYSGTTATGTPISTIPVKNIGLNTSWKEISAMFNSASSSSVTIQLINKAAEGQGNDLLLDDITLSVCTPKANLVCSNGTAECTLIPGQKETLTASIVSGVMENPYYLWQYQSNKAGWMPIGAPEVNKTEVEVIPESNPTLYRVIIANTAEEALNIAYQRNPSACGMYAITNTVTANVVNLGLISNLSDGSICADGVDKNTLTLKVTNPLNVAVTGVKVAVEIPDGVTAYNAGTTTAFTGFPEFNLTPSGTKTLKLDLKSTAAITASQIKSIKSYIAKIFDLTWDNESALVKASSDITVNPVPTAKFADASENICKGSTTIGTNVIISNGSPNYTLTIGGTNYTATTSPYLFAVNPTSTTTYTLTKVMDSKGCYSTPTTNNIVTVNVEEIKITSQPKAASPCIGDPATFSVTASGADTYQWQSSSDQSSWTNISNATSSTYTISSTTANDNNKFYRVVVSKKDGKCNAVESSSAQLTIKTTAAPTVLKTEYKECATTGKVNVQLNTLFSGTNLKFYSDAALTNQVTTFDASDVVTNKKYYATQTVNGCTSKAAEIPVTVLELPKLVSATTDKMSICGTEVDSKATLSYQFEKGTAPYKLTVVRTEEGKTPEDPRTTDPLPASGSYELKPTVTTTYTFTQVEDANKCKSTSATGLVSDVEIEVVNLELGPDLQDKTACADQTLTYSITPLGENLHYQWYESTDGGRTYSEVGDGKTTYTTNTFEMTDNKKYKVEVYQVPKVCAFKTSTPSAVTVQDCSKLSISELSGVSTSVCSDQEIELNYSVTNGDVATDVEVTFVNLSKQTFVSSSSEGYDHTTGIWKIGKLENGETATISIKVKGTTVVTNEQIIAYISKSGSTTYNENTGVKAYKTITVKAITAAPELISETYKACPEDGLLDLKTQISSDKSNLVFYTTATGTSSQTQAEKDEIGTTTYWVTNTIEGECESPRTPLDIVVYAKPTATISGTTSICSGEPANLTINLTGENTFYIALSNGEAKRLVSGPSTTMEVSPTSTTTYTLTEVKDGHQCSADLSNSGSATITVNAAPSLDNSAIGVVPQNICDGDVITLPNIPSDANGSTITSTKWYFNGKEYKEGDKVEYSDDVDGVELKLEYEATNDCGSTKVDAGKYIIKPRPTIESFEITDEDNIICEGASTTLSVQFKGEAPFTFYINEEEYQTNNATWTTTISKAGTYTITALSDKYCTAESSAEKEVTLIVEELPVVTLDATEVTLNCAKQTATITASGASTYEWSYVDESGATQTKTGATLDVKQTNKEVPTLVTEYSVYGYSEKAGCKSENAVTVEVTEDFVLPKVNMTTYNFGMDVDLEKDLILTCNHYAVQLFADAANSPVEVANYEWSTGEKGEDYSIITAKSAATYFVDITAVNGCKITDSIKVTENFKTPDISLTSYRIAKNERVESTVLTCTYQTLNLEATINNPEEIGVEDVYLYWSLDGRDFAGPNPLEISEEGVYTVFIQGDNYCKGDTSIVITAAQDHPVLTLTSSANEINCYTPSIDLEVESDIDSVSYDWIKWLQVSPDGSKEGEMVTGDSIATIDKGGYYEVIVTVDSTGCASSEKVTIAENTRKPIINSLISSTTLDKTIEGYKETKIVNCEDTELFIQSTVVDSIQVGYRPEELEYEWTVSYDKGDIFEEYGKSETISTKEEAIFRLVVTDKESGCSAVADSIHIKENKTTPTITAMTSVSTIDPSAEKVEETNVLTCEYPVLYLKPTITSENEFSYKWDDGSTENYREVKEEGTYSLVVTDNTSFCSTEEYKYSVTEDNDKPILSVDTIYYLCPSDTLSITKLSSLLPKANGFIYKFYDESETEIEDLYEVPSESSATKYFVAGISDNGCISDTLSFSVDYAKNVDFTLTTSQTSMLVGGNETVVTIVPDADSEILDAYTWLVNGNEVDVDGLEHSSNLYIDTKFEVTATNRCDSDTKEAFVEVLWPTAFTPHNDNGKNEDFAKGMYIIVFNRFYTKIFEGLDGWDGTINGTMNDSKNIAVPGVYYYSVKLPNGEVKKGTIEIVKID